MPTKIPVHIGHHEFGSMNKARLHYREILYKYEVGNPVSDVDKNQVLELVDSAGLGCPAPSTREKVRVVKGSYGRRCFEVRTDNETSHLVSIMRSVRGCTVPPQKTCVIETCAPEVSNDMVQAADERPSQRPMLGSRIAGAPPSADDKGPGTATVA